MRLTVATTVAMGPWPGNLLDTVIPDLQDNFRLLEFIIGRTVQEEVWGIL